MPRRQRIRPQTANSVHGAERHGVVYGRHTGAWLALFVVLTVLFSGGALLARHKLEGLRAMILEAAEARTGTALDVKSISLSGLRGLRIEEPVVRLRLASGASFQIQVPLAYVYVDFVDLLSGALIVDRVQLDGAIIRVERLEEEPWLSPGSGPRVRALPVLGDQRSLRLAGQGCRLDIVNILGANRLTLEDLDFDLSRVAESPGFRASVSGNLAGAPTKTFQVDLDLTSTTDFRSHLEFENLAAEDVNVFLPTAKHIVQSGVTDARARIHGYPDGSFVLSMESSFRDLAIREQPPFLQPLSGTLAAQGRYRADDGVMSITSAQVETDQASGALKGTVAFAQGRPIFDLKLSTDRLPVQEILDHALEGRLEQYGVFDLRLGELESLALTFKGDPAAYALAAQLDVRAGELAFTPKDRRYPAGDLTFGLMEASWDSSTNAPRGIFHIVDGSVQHAESGLKADNVSGLLVIDGTHVTLDPLNVDLRGNMIVGAAEFDFAARKGRASVSGTLEGIENTGLATAIRHTELAGSATLQADLVIDKDRCRIEKGSIDTTQTQILYRWWFLKPPGVGASATFTGEWVRRNKLSLHASLSAVGTRGEIDLLMAHDGSKWRLMHTTAVSDKVDVVAAGRCLRIPYRITGDVATDCSYEWVRDEATAPDGPMYWHSTARCTIGDISCVPDGSDVPMRAKGVTVEARFANGVEKTGHLDVSARRCWMPPLGTTWFLSPDVDPEIRAKYPISDRHYTYGLSAESMEVPPWKGTDFVATAHHNREETGLDSYEAMIEQGQLKGTYLKNRSENTYKAAAQWTDIPAAYLIKHLRFPEVLRGIVTGDVRYEMDYDDPRTLQGKGSFKIEDGQFSADFILYELGQQLNGDAAALPPSLQFSHLSAAVEFEKDLVRTPKVRLLSEGIEIEGEGFFITDGDMDYDLNVAVSPEIAAQIPLLREYLNLEGHRIAQQDIELAFKVTGPTFDPKSELAESPPLSVALMTGGLEVVSDAVKVIDIPRKILLDLLKMGGGIVGVKKPGP